MGARDELHRMLNEDELREAILIVFANKQDLPNAMNAAEITDKLGLHSLRQRNWYIQATGSTKALTGCRRRWPRSNCTFTVEILRDLKANITSYVHKISAFSFERENILH